MDYEAAIDACGFDCVGTCPASELRTRTEVRDMCASGRCPVYGNNWACPPHCGTLEEYAETFAGKTTCYVLQTVVELEDEFDAEGMMAADALQHERMRKLAELLRPGADVLVLSSGTCDMCPKCSCPDGPCRFPEKQLTSMEAAGLVVGDACTSAGIPYNHGKGTIAYTGCLVV